jgi:hypothetical protein
MWLVIVPGESVARSFPEETTEIRRSTHTGRPPGTPEGAEATSGAGRGGRRQRKKRIGGRRLLGSLPALLATDPRLAEIEATFAVRSNICCGICQDPLNRRRLTACWRSQVQIEGYGPIRCRSSRGQA